MLQPLQEAGHCEGGEGGGGVCVWGVGGGIIDKGKLSSAQQPSPRSLPCPLQHSPQHVEGDGVAEREGRLVKCRRVQPHSVHVAEVTVHTEREGEEEGREAGGGGGERRGCS